MNQFVDKFGDAIKSYWETASEYHKQQLLNDVLQYTNTNPTGFRQELMQVQFDSELSPLAIVLEALSKDTDNWGNFYVDTLNTIFDQAKNVNKPQEILNCLMEFAYIEKDPGPFIQKIVDRLYQEINADNLATKLAAIWMLPAYLKNPSVKNKSLLVKVLQQQLHDKNWKVRYVAFTSLGYEEMLPAGFRLSIADRIRKIILGTPPTV